MEQIRLSLRRARWHNYTLLQGLSRKQLAARLLANLPAGMTKLRLHVGGDFFSQRYFDAWLDVAVARPQQLFYAYTKSVRYWVRRLHLVGTGYHRKDVPLPNMILTASYGGKDDRLIAEHGLRYSVVVKHPLDAEAMGMEIDHDDSHSMRHGPSFCLLVHSHQKAGSSWARAVQDLKDQGLYSYGPKSSRRALPIL